MALVLVCMTAPLGYTQTLCKKCGVATPIGECVSGQYRDTDRPCVDIKNLGRAKPAWALPGSPATEPARTIGQSPEWSADGVSIDNKDDGKAKVCPKCGKAIPIDEKIKALENQP